MTEPADARVGPADMAALLERLQTAERTVEAIRTGAADAIIVDGADGPVVFTLQGTGEVYQAFVETMNEGAVTVDGSGLVLYANSQTARMLGLPLEQVIGSRLEDHITSGQDAHVTSDLAGLLHEATSQGVQVRMRSADGRLLPVLLSARVIDSPQHTVCVVLTDLSDLLAGQHASRRLAAIVDGTDDAVVGLDADLVVESVNAGAAAMFGFDGRQAVGQPVATVFGGQVAALAGRAVADGHSHKADVRPSVAGADPGGVSVVAVTAAPVVDGDGALTGVSLLGHDVTDRHVAEELLRERAWHDELTGLPNRAGFIDRVGTALARAPAQHQALLFIDIDRFKQVNDTLGHSGGDDLLRSLGGRLSAALRPGDVAARVGGDEFVVLCTDLGTGRRTATVAAVDIADRIRAIIAEPVTEADGRLIMTPSASIGVAVVHGPGQSVERLLHDADSAMYRAKEMGRSRTVVFDDLLQQQTRDRERTIAEARRVVADHALRLHYQPIVDLRREGVVGYEALLRWQHPEDGLSMPRTLLDVADDAGMSVPIGDWVITQALQRLRRMIDGDGFTGFMSINMAAAQIGHGHLLERLVSETEALSIDPRRVCLEVTEDVSLDRTEEAIAELVALAGHGFCLALDDFGTGYASLTHLQRLPLTYLKIDRSFVAAMGRAGTRPDIVAPIIHLAKVVGLEVVAEGVETDEQLDALRELGCDMSQGFLHGVPSA